MENKFAHTFGSTGLAAAEPMGDNVASLGATVGATATPTSQSSVGATATATLPSSVGATARSDALFEQYMALVDAKAPDAERYAALNQYIASTANDDPGGGSMDQIGGNVCNYGNNHVPPMNARAKDALVAVRPAESRPLPTKKEIDPSVSDGANEKVRPGLGPQPLNRDKTDEEILRAYFVRKVRKGEA
jgi:hypothetical protein